MNPGQRDVLDLLYQREDRSLERNEFDVWTTPVELANALPSNHLHHGDVDWVEAQLGELWVMRKVMQVPDKGVADHHELVDVKLGPLDVHGEDEARLAVEQDDVRGELDHPYEQVAVFPAGTRLRYRSRMAETARLLARNPQRFGMAPSTGLLRYERRPQIRPVRTVTIDELAELLKGEIRQGVLKGGTLALGLDDYPLDDDIDRVKLVQAVEAALGALAHLLGNSNLAEFQVESLRAIMCGLYSRAFRKRYDAQVITAGVGSGKTFAFQVGAIVHVAYKAICGVRKLRVLLIYPRVVLAANQFNDLFDLVDETSRRLPDGADLSQPVLDAGGNLKAQMGYAGDKEKGALYKSIRKAYQGNYQILISNLDSLANRMVHPDAARWLVKDLDLIVMDEVHILGGFYGAHARMLLKRLRLGRALWSLRERYPKASFGDLLKKQKGVPRPYFVGASATIAEPKRHVGKILDLGDQAERILHVDVGETQETGWVHHIFLRQRPEASSLTAVTNATSCVIHNRRDGLIPEYYQHSENEGGRRRPISADALGQPALPTAGVEPRDPRHVHKTLGFCDSLDGVGRWADLVADNERTKGSSMGASANPNIGENIPYYARFNEPLWRVVHHLSFAAKPPAWQNATIQAYGALCRACKHGVRCKIPRVPDGLTPKQEAKVDGLWSLADDEKSFKTSDHFLQRLGVSFDNATAEWFAPVIDAGQSVEIGNLDDCGFFRTGLCWWWSRDHLGNNKPTPATQATPLNSYKSVHRHPEGRFHGLAGARVLSFTSNTGFNAMGVDSINEVFRAEANKIFRDMRYGTEDRDVLALLIGSPRIEVGIDLARACDGITFRAMRDPAGLQQKAGRVGREADSDSMVVHVVTENSRDHYYLRNPQLALDPAYLQPIPLHEQNRLVACQHYFMAIVDFLLLQAEGPGAERIADEGDRLALINDHGQLPDKSFKGWEKKVAAAYHFLFGDHARQAVNRLNLERYLQVLGAKPSEISDPSASSIPAESGPMSGSAGAMDVFEHDFGPKLLLQELSVQGHHVPLARLVASDSPRPPVSTPGLPRHQDFIETYSSYNTPPGGTPNAFLDRSYLWDILCLPVFRRGIPTEDIPGNLPFLWAPNFFEAAGNEHVRVFEQRDSGKPRELGYETVSLAMSLLAPGTFTYRYTVGARKVAVSDFGAQGVQSLGNGLHAAFLRIDDPEYYAMASDAVDAGDLPGEFAPFRASVDVYMPRQLGLTWAVSTPSATPNGLVVDGDEAPIDSQPQHGLPTPPRCFALHWYRVRRRRAAPLVCRFSNRFCGPGGEPLPPLALPPVMGVFEQITSDDALDVTEFVWGLDRVFSNRSVQDGRLVYRQGGEAPDAARPVALGQAYTAPGMCFELSLADESPVGRFLRQAVDDEVSARSAQRQSSLVQALHAHLAKYAREPVDPDADPWAPRALASSFTVKSLVKVVLFHLLERWHPEGAQSAPGQPFVLTLESLRGCFTDGHSLHIDRERFEQICDAIAFAQLPESARARYETLEATWPYFSSACESDAMADLTQDWLRERARDVLLNSLGLALHDAALRLTGAESSDLAYFYRVENESAWIYLFDKSPFGNGTVEVLRRNFFVSPAERSVVTRQSMLGGAVDPLPTKDFVTCFEENLQECASSHASQLAFYDIGGGPGLEEYVGTVAGERQIGGSLFDFMRHELGLSSFDDVAALQAVPEFLVHAQEYPAHGTPLVPGGSYPTFQALESAMGFCHHGCIACVLNPEQNVHGVLSAGQTANKLLLDAFYRVAVCEQEAARTEACYPGTGPSRTVPWSQVALTAASAAGAPYHGVGAVNVEVETKKGPDVVTVVPSTVLGSWSAVFRTGWTPEFSLEPTFRIRMGDVYPLHLASDTGV